MHVFYVWLWLSAHDSRNYEYWVVAVAGSFSLDGIGAHDVDCGVDVAVGDDVAFFIDEHPFIGRIFIFIEDWKLEEKTNSISMVVVQDASIRYEQIYYICKIYDLINGIDEHKQIEMKNTNFLSREINLNC